MNYKGKEVRGRPGGTSSSVQFFLLVQLAYLNAKPIWNPKWPASDRRQTRRKLQYIRRFLLDLLAKLPILLPFIANDQHFAS